MNRSFLGKLGILSLVLAISLSSCKLPWDKDKDDSGGGGTPVEVDKTPTVSITNPANSATVSGTVNVTADVSDDNGISKVQFYIDGVIKSTDTSSPYSYSWDTTAESDGSHTVKVTAYDTANQTANDQHSVTVDNIPIEYKVTGTASTVLVTYQNKDSGTSQEYVSIPWSYSFSAIPGTFVYISAQNQGDTGSVTVTIYKDSTVLKTSTSSGAYVIATASDSL